MIPKALAVAGEAQMHIDHKETKHMKVRDQRAATLIARSHCVRFFHPGAFVMNSSPLFEEAIERV
jgi:hypothetical protein